MKKKHHTSKTNNTGDSPAAFTWQRPARLLVSLWLVFHLLALVAAPLAGPPPSSELSREAAGWLEWYIRPLFLGHGYRFFAPNPGPSHRVRYELEQADGTVVAGVFPNVNDQWPRLLYHRMFMLSETVNNVTALPPRQQLQETLAAGKAEAAELRADGFWRQAARIEAELEAQAASYEEAVRNRDRLLKGLAEHLADKHQAVRVRIYAQEHLIPTPLDVELGMSLDDPELILEEQVYSWEAPQR